MGQRREPRKAVEVSVRIFGTDADGKIFSQSVTTVDVSRNGLRLCGVQARIAVDEIIGVTYGKSRVHFRTKWVGEPGTLKEGQIGLLNLTPEKSLWDFSLPPGTIDRFHYAGKDRRRFPRVKCSISAELHPTGQPVVWAKVSDLSLGGCYIEMPIPLAVGSKLEVLLWLGTNKVRFHCEVASASRGVGIGMRFTDVSEENLELLRHHIQTLI
jgi:hypothetical protein